MDRSGIQRRREGLLGRGYRRLAALLTTVVLLIGTTGLAGAVRAIADTGDPNCATNGQVETPTQGCDYYITESGNPVLAGSNTISPSYITDGTAVSQTATVHTGPMPYTLGNISGTTGVYYVTLAPLSGTVNSYSPTSSAAITAYLDPHTNQVTWSEADGTPLPAGFTATLGNTATSIGQIANCACTANGAQWGSDGVINQPGWSFTNLVTVTASNGAPTASFTATQSAPATSPGQYQFVSTSTDPSGEALDLKWDFGDGTTAAGPSNTHTFKTPGPHTVTLTATDTSGESDTSTQTIKVPAPKLQVGLDFVNAQGTVLPTVTPKVGDTIYVRLTMSASDDGVGSIAKIAPPTGTDLLSATPTASVTIGKPATPLPSPLTLAAGKSRSAIYPVVVNAAGVVRFTSAASGVDDSGATVQGTAAQLSLGVSTLKVTLTANPATFTQDESASGTKPVDVTVTETVTNTTDQPLTSVDLASFGPQRSVTGQLLDVTQTTGPVPDPLTGFSLPNLPAGGSDTFSAHFSVKSNGQIQFASLVTAASPDSTTQRGYGSTTINVKPKYWLEFSSRVITPNAGLLPAGSNIVIQGSVHNPSDTATDDVGPLFAQTSGNAGLQGLAYGDTGVNPRAMQEPGDLTLDPGDTKDFTLEVSTAYSDPTGAGGVLPSGGTSAEVGFSPWAKVTQSDGTSFTTTDDQVLYDHGDDDITHRVSIDDSVPLPATDPAAIAGGVLLGGLQGVWNAASGMVTGLINLPNVASSTLYAVAQYQDQIWNAFTPAQRDAFDEDAANAIVPVLEANATTAAKGATTLFQQASTFVYTYFTTLDNAWQTGDYADVVHEYSELGGNALAQIAIPALLGKLATSGAAVEAVDAAQTADQASIVEATAGLSDAETMTEAVPSLTKIASGTELTASLVQKMYGIAQAELTALQNLATKYDFLLVVRSRAASSLEWLEDFAAMVKPEAIKIKSVSDLDVKLGYPASAEGSLIFKEPVPLMEWKTGGGAYSSYVQSYVESRGFTPGTGEYYDAIQRIADRTSEWNKYAATYERWNKQGWVDTSFNWKGNAMEDPNVGGSGKITGFHLKPTGTPGEYRVQLYNPKVGRFVPVTGDIDPIAFTHIDGTPLTAAEHAELVNEMRLDPNLQTQHGESATYVDGGIDFIESQFKPNEAALMIAPGGGAPRAVRFDPTQSTWKSASKYHLVWDGGFVDAGAEPATDATVQLNDAQLTAPATPAPTDQAQAIPGSGTTAEPNVGRCAFSYSTSPGTPALEVSPQGAIVQVVGTTMTPSPLEQTCFSAGPVVTVTTQPSTVTSTTIPAGTTEVPVQTTTPYAGDSTTDGFAVGDTVSIDPGTDDAETGQIAGFGSIIFSKPLRYSHAAGTVITVTSEPALSTSLAATGDRDLPDDMDIAVFLLLSGGLALAAGRRRQPA